MGESVDIFNFLLMFQRERIHRAKMIDLQVDPCVTPQESQWGTKGNKSCLVSGNVLLQRYVVPIH